MEYKTLMVHLDLNGDNEGLLNIAADLARRFNAKVIGIAACQPIQVLFSEGCPADDVIAQNRTEIAKELAAAESQFRDALAGHAQAVEWRSNVTLGSPARYLADEVRAADLIITGKDTGPRLLDKSRRVSIGDLAMQAGRPILAVPNGVSSLTFRHVIVGWKESREARRAVADALPLLKAAGRCTVLEVVPEGLQKAAQARVDDVASWLSAHQVASTPEVIVTTDTDAKALRISLADRKCDLLIAGAYGHNRLTEWFFGSVTRDVLLDPPCCVLISH